MKVRGRCFTVPHYLSNFPFVGRPRYFSPVPVLAGEKYHTMNLTKNTVGFRRHFCLLYLFFYYTISTYLTFDKDANNCEKLSVSR